MSDPFYRSKAWRRLRWATLQRDPYCIVRGCGAVSMVADHIVPRTRGGADTLANLRGLCTPCHNRRSAQGNAEPRAIGCNVDGSPRDPAHPWLSEKMTHLGKGDAKISQGREGATALGKRAHLVKKKMTRAEKK